MPDPQFHSMHLEGLPRQAEFRAARQVMERGCGQQTLGGDLGWLAADESGNGETRLGPNLARTFWVQDGERLYTLVIGVNSVGRLPDNSVVLRDECVSRRHCAIVVHCDGSCELHDIASKNGTVLNGARIHGPTKLRPGDRIALCAKQLIFLIRDDRVESKGAREGREK